MATETAINPEPIHAFFNKLDSRKTLLTTITDLHKTLTTHFTTINNSLDAKSETLDRQIKEFKENTENALAKLQIRENSIPELESSLAVQVGEKKEDAIAEIEKSKEVEDFAESLKEKDPVEVLRIHCKRMDASGLVRFLQSKRKECAAMKPEISAALQCSVDPLRLILDAVEEYATQKVERKLRMAERRWACDLLMQSVVPVVEGDYGAGRSLKERAERVLKKMRRVLGHGDRVSGVGAAEATMFLQFVIAFTLKEKCEEKFLRKLVIEFADRKDMPKYAAALLGNKTRDIIEELVKKDKEVEAVYFVYESGLTEQYPPLSLLKAHLRNCRRSANNLSKSGRFRSEVVEKANCSELDSTRAIIKCVEDHKLEAEFPLEGLQKRVAELENAKAERKKGSKFSRKRDRERERERDRRRGHGKPRDPSSRPPKSARLSNPSPSRSSNLAQSHHVPPVRYSAVPHSYTSQQIVYEAPSTVSYPPTAYSAPHAQSPAPQYGYAAQEAGAYGGTHTQNPAPLPPQYGYGAQEAGVSGARSYHTAYGGQSGYPAYDYSLAPPGTAYPPSYPPQ